MIHIVPAATPNAITEVLSASMRRDPISARVFTSKVLLDPNFREAGSLMATHGGAPSGYCLAIARQVPLENAPNDDSRGYITLLGVLPERRRAGVATALLDAAEEYLRDQGRSEVWVSPYAPNYFIPGVDVDAYSEGLAFFLARGYREVYRPLAMEVGLYDIEEPDWVRKKRAAWSGSPLTACDQAAIVPLIRFAERVFPGDWVRVVRESFRDIDAGADDVGLFVARDQNGRIVGFSHFRRERFGPIGVDPDERGKGIGQFLMYETLRAQREAGFRTSWFLWSDDKTAARLYSDAGFREVRRFAVLKKDL